MKKLSQVLFLSLCFGFSGLVLWGGLSHAQPPFLGGIPQCQTNLNMCTDELDTCTTNESMCADELEECEAQPPASLPQTGQTTCSDSGGNGIPCADTGQDGDVQAGVEWPSPRFTDNDDGTITDNLTKLVWLKDASCFGDRTWALALIDANTLNSGECDLTDNSVEGDWHLPNRNELTSLLDLGNWSPALPTGHPFTNLLQPSYWSSTTDAFSPNNVWMVNIVDGGVENRNKIETFGQVLPVRGGS
jgi:hypothetical protein